MKVQKIGTNFSRYSDADFENKAGHILASMTGNPSFPDPIPTLADVQAALTRYSDALLAAAGLGRVNVAEKNQARQQLELLLTQLGMFVMYKANGNVAMLTSSGYTLNKYGEPSYISNPGNVTLTNGITSGEMIGTIPAVKAAKSYQHQITAEPPTEATNWMTTSSSRRTCTFKNLIPGKQYWVRVGVTGSREQQAYSTVATQFAQ